MTEIKIPFTEDMKIAAWSDLKHATTRSKVYGRPGDTFRLEHEGKTKIFILVGVIKLPLWFVSKVLYRLEGFSTPAEFTIKWNKLHPKRKYNPLDMRYVHLFDEV